jgi:hypothetical protein
MKIKGIYYESGIEHHNQKTLSIIGESKENVIIVCMYHELRARVFFSGGTGNVIFKNFTVIQISYTNKNAFHLESTGNFMMEDCILKQGVGFFFFFQEILLIMNERCNNKLWIFRVI